MILFELLLPFLADFAEAGEHPSDITIWHQVPHLCQRGPSLVASPPMPVMEAYDRLMLLRPENTARSYPTSRREETNAVSSRV